MRTVFLMIDVEPQTSKRFIKLSNDRNETHTQTLEYLLDVCKAKWEICEKRAMKETST